MEFQSSGSTFLTGCGHYSFLPDTLWVPSFTASDSSKVEGNRFSSHITLRSSFKTTISDGKSHAQIGRRADCLCRDSDTTPTRSGLSGCLSRSFSKTTFPVNLAFDRGTNICLSYLTLKPLARRRQPVLSERSTILANSNHICWASIEGNTGQSSPEEDDSTPDTSSTEAGGSGKGQGQPTLEADWRNFRARLVAGEHASSNNAESESSIGTGAETTSGALGKSWAHPLPGPETGCVLVATEKLDGEANFERTVILLLRVGSNNPREGPFGIILNRPLLQSINELKPANRALANIFGACQLHFGGPLEADMFLLLQDGGVKLFEEVIPGVYFGGSDGLQQASDLVRENTLLPQDFRFYVGYSGWGLNQLRSEIAAGLWCVAACSTDLITAASTDNLWEEILLLMGGQYAELSRKPKRDTF